MTGYIETHWPLALLVLALFWGTRRFPEPMVRMVRRATVRRRS